jgi:hypothetical protein
MTRNKSRATQRGPEDRPHAEADAALQAEAAPPTAEPLTSPPAEVVDRSEYFAVRLRETVVPLFLSANCCRALPQIDIAAYQRYRDRLLADCGNPKDPIEVMLIEQLVLAHLNTGLLHCRSSHSNSIETAAVYLSAAARLTGEFRRTALALQAYRAASARLAEMAEADVDVPTGEVLEPADELEENYTANEIETARSDDPDGPTILPFRRSATV